MRQLQLVVLGAMLMTAVLACAPAASPTPATSTPSSPAATPSSPAATAIAAPQATTPATAPAATSAPSAATDKNYTVRIGYPATVRDQPAPIGPDVWALNQGLFDAEFKADGINFQFIPFLAAGPAMNEAITGGSLDLGTYADTPGVIGKAAGVKMSLVAIANATGPAWLLVRGPSTFQKVADLKGKKVATIKATFPHLFLLDVLKANGMSASDIELVNMNFADSEAALHAGQVDAIVSPGSNALRLRKGGDRSIYSTDDLPSARGLSVIVASDSFIAAHPTFFSRYYRARARAIDWANANHEAALSQLAKASGPNTTPDVISQLYPDPTFPFDLAMTPDLIGRIQGTEAFLREAGLTRQQVDIDAWINKSVALKPS